MGAGVGGCGKGSSSIPGLDRFHAGVMQGRLLISFVATKLTLDEGLSFPVPGLKEAQLAFAPDLASAGTVIQFSAALESENALPGILPPAHLEGLPDGRPLPDIRGGRLPRRALPLGPIEVSLYLSEETWGVFLPLKLKNSAGIGLPWTIRVPLKDERGNAIGKAYAIPALATSQHEDSGGILLLVPFVSTQSSTL